MRLLAVFVLAWLAGCASRPPLVPDDFAGPVATIRDTAGPENYFFHVVSVDGQRPPSNSPGASVSASFGQGPVLTQRLITHRVKAGRARIEIGGERVFAAPIQVIVASARDRIQPITGVVEADLAPGGRYIVNGVVDGFRREIWLEDEATRAIVGQKILYRPPAAPEGSTTLFTCCNMHYRDRSIVVGQWSGTPPIPPGTPVVLASAGRSSSDILVDGRSMTLRHPITSADLTAEQLLDRILLKADPRAALDGYPADVREAIRLARVMKGMTKAQVLMATGHPTPRHTPSLDSRRWIYEPFADYREERLELVFDEAGVLISIEGTQAARSFAEK